ncbi:hypothetical protein QKT49_gp089 [Acanthamoeba castellanii medusavirus]|uniref:Uncharacterized protein n=1 Tax=Acanthamoeba castellanii medusavirus J1 TaxID=3114988 RepID=A0A3T1CWP3_9VIRU|nr:hypothetical protein QKT49_gp089 [Acanthamoeba castellanii medusavirus]BBI30229.1 hypothetical protein [Acanthamoeba castellanii medusavirus J1]
MQASTPRYSTRDLNAIHRDACAQLLVVPGVWSVSVKRLEGNETPIIEVGVKVQDVKLPAAIVIASLDHQCFSVVKVVV